MRKILLNVTDGSLAGGGISSMFRESKKGFQSLCVARGYEMITISGAPDSKTNRQFGFTAAGFAGRHNQAAEFVSRLMKKLVGAEISVFVWGYTSYFPHAFHKYLQRGDIKALAWADSSPPDTENLGEDISTSRFVASAYEGTTEIIWSWHDFNEHDPRLTRRVPRGAELLKTARPFPSQYIETLWDMQGARRVVDRGREALVVFATSPDYWDEDAIGKWITKQQWQDVRNKTWSLLSAFETVADRLSSRRHLTVVANPALGVMTFHRQPENYDLRLEKFEPQAYRELLARADLCVVRTSCCVTSVECAHIGVPQYLYLAPAFGYMNVDVFEDSAREQEVVCPVRDTLAEGILSGIGPDNRYFQLKALNRARDFNHSHNFFSAIDRVLL